MLRAARQDELELAAAIRLGAARRPVQAYGNYFEGRRSSCALGAAYEGIYRLPELAESLRPRHLERLFDCLENTIRNCPEGCRKRLPLGPLIVHLNDDHQWSRERIAGWVAGGDAPQTPTPPQG
jgi:hypothetical protein